MKKKSIINLTLAAIIALGSAHHSQHSNQEWEKDGE